ncbi:MAG: hypothetical protein GY946_22605, partial [bacterium]|nr:hypothetical protein [bacterium]
MDLRWFAGLRRVCALLLLTSLGVSCRGENRSPRQDEDDHIGQGESQPTVYGEPGMVRLTLMDDEVRIEADGLPAMWDLMLPEEVFTEPDHTLLYPEGQAWTGCGSDDSGELTCVGSLDGGLDYTITMT